MTVPMLPVYQYAATLVAVHDGDTITVTVDLGFRVAVTTPVRLLGINAPELSTAAGKVSAEWTRQWFGTYGTTLTIVSAKSLDEYGDKYGRYLATVYIRGGTQSFNDAIVAAGYALPWDGTGPKPVASP